MNIRKYSLFIIITIAWVIIGLNIDLPYTTNFKPYTLSNTNLYIHETGRGRSHFVIGEYSVLCAYAIDSDGKSICDIEGIHKIYKAELIVAYYKIENIEENSDAYLKSAIYEIINNDGEVVYHNFIVQDKQIEQSKNQSLWSKKGVPIFLIFMNYIWLFLYLSDNNKHKTIPMLTFYGLMFIVFYFII